MKGKIHKFFAAFPHAFRGIISGFKERNMKFHGVAAVLVLLVGAVMGLDRFEWFMVYILIGLVWSAELINTAIEELADLIRDEEGLPYQATKRARDTAAGAVLVLAGVAAFIGGVIFMVRFVELMGWV